MIIDNVAAISAIALENPLPRVALVVDDSMLIRHTVCRYLEERGFTCEIATNGKEALEVLSHTTPELIITDLNMPKMDGNELIEKLKSSPKTAGIPIVVLQGKTTKDEASATTRADVAIYKDIEIVAQLDAALKKVLPKH
jgi:CheY-like chemotaxis protein